MSASHEKPRSVEVSSTLSSLESSDLSGDRSDQDHHLTVGGKVLRIVIAFVMMFACALTPPLLSQIPAVRSFGLAHSHPQGNVDDLVMAAFILLLYGTATILVLMLCYVLRRTLDRGRRVSLCLRLKCRALLWVVGMVVTAIAVEFAVAGVVHILGLASGNEGMPNRPWWFIAAAIFSQAFFLQGIPEEIIWRGWLFSSLGETRFAAVSSVLGFTVLHLLSQGGQQNLFEHLTYLALPCGFAVTALIVRLVSGSTWAAIGVHGGFHMVNYFVSSSMHLPGDSVTWVLQGLLLAVVGLLILVFHRRHRRLVALAGRPC